MRTSQVAAATITWARSREDAVRLRDAVASLVETGVPVAVSDRESAWSLADMFANTPGIQVASSRATTLVGQVQASVAAALADGRPFVLYVEPDKRQFFDRGLAEFIAGAPDTPDVGVVLAARSPASFATFPPMQQHAERVINDACAALLGPAGDYSYGPFLMHRTVCAEVLRLPTTLGWGWRHATFAAAARVRRTLVLLEGDYPCPPEQRPESDADRRYRLRQLSENLAGLVHTPATATGERSIV